MKSKYTAHLHPGKFEGESAATEYYYELMLEGVGEDICGMGGESEEGLLIQIRFQPSSGSMLKNPKHLSCR